MLFYWSKGLIIGLKVVKWNIEILKTVHAQQKNVRTLAFASCSYSTVGLLAYWQVYVWSEQKTPFLP